MPRETWKTDKPFVQVSVNGDRILLRTFPASGAAPVVVEMDTSEALGLATDLTNRARVLVERGMA